MSRLTTWPKDLCVLATALLLFYLLWLGHHPFFTPDEGRYAEVAREMTASGDYITPRIDGVPFLDKPVFYYWLQALAIQIAGVNEWALRFFPVCFGIIGCLAVYICGRLLFTRRTGLLAAIMLALTPLYFGGAHYADLNLEVAVLISLTLLCFITFATGTAPWRRYFLFAAYIFGALAFLTKGLIGLAFPCMIAGSFILLTRQFDLIKRMHLLAGLLIFVVIAAPWYWLVQQANPTFLHYFFVTQQVTRFLSTAEFNNKTPYWFYVPIILAGFFPWTIFLIQAVYKSLRNSLTAPKTHQAELFLLAWVIIITVFFSIPHSKTIGYIFPVFPALSLLTARYLDTIWDKPQKLLSILLFISLSITLACLLLLLPHYNWLHFAAGFTFYRYILASIFFVSAVLSLFLIKKRLPVFFILCAACNAFFLVTLLSGATYLNDNSAKPLTTKLKPLIQPQDEVACYFRFFQDVPLYLQRQVTLVADWQAAKTMRDNWMRELAPGMALQKTNAWLIDETHFWQRWNSDKRIFVFTSHNFLAQFTAQAKHYFYLGTNQNILLLTNKPL